jgi:S1-C subfamily serine protease
MNCNNRTLGHKTLQQIDHDLRVVPKSDFTYADNKIEFKPLEPSAYSDKLFNYVCGQTNVDKKVEDVHEVSLGTGWPTQFGYIMTNQHVINGKKKITVVSTSGEKFSAAVLIEDKINDLAVLQVDHPGKLPPALPIANASARTGSKVFTIGYPHPDVMGEKPKLTEGIVNAISGYMDDPRILQISVPVQAGNSGGPLLNMNGEVVGIVTAKLSAVKMFNWTGDLPQNVNYAIKASYITALLKSIKEQSTVTKMLPVKRADLESLSSRIQNSVFLVIGE